MMDVRKLGHLRGTVTFRMPVWCGGMADGISVECIDVSPAEDVPSFSPLIQTEDLNTIDQSFILFLRFRPIFKCKHNARDNEDEDKIDRRD